MGQRPVAPRVVRASPDRIVGSDGGGGRSLVPDLPRRFAGSGCPYRRRRWPGHAPGPIP
jgi:hypothetical protein